VEITFDPRKSERNRIERGFGFESAAEFDFASAIYTEDRRRDYGETRIRALGRIEDLLYAMVFTMRGTTLRVISLRRASRRERKRYAETRS
jgi:uncharacterized DUF497 family protein